MEKMEEKIRNACWEKALHAFGTARIFEWRANKLKWKLRALTFLSLSVPLSVGGIYLAFGDTNKYLPIAISVAGVLGVFQIVVSLWSIISKWQDNLTYSFESASSNYRLSRSFKSLANNPPDNFTEQKMRFDILEVDESHINDQDNKQGISEKELRKGMRAALREFHRSCAHCNQVPSSMEPTECDVCGNF